MMSDDIEIRVQSASNNAVILR